MTRVLIAITLMAALALCVFSVTPANAVCRGQDSDVTKPYYNCGTHLIILKVKIEDSDCFDEVYARATPQGFNHVVLNKQTYRNNDEPDAGPSDDKKTFKWKFSGEKVVQTSKDSIRVYAQLELLDGSTKTVTKYRHEFNINTVNYDFGYFHLHAPATLCLKK
jgi:hypothetical protein